MIISRTPLRVSFVGGATDISNYYSKYGGRVISTSINKYIYVTFNKRVDNRIIISYSKHENVENICEIENNIIKEALMLTKLINGFEIHIISDISTVGTGLGGSSAVAVGVLRVLFPKKSKREIAKMACDIEIETLGKCIGKQDQYACTMGGVNELIFQKNGNVRINKILGKKHFQYYNMYLSPLNFRREKAENLLKIQNNRFDENVEILHQIKNLCKPFKKAIKTASPREVIKLLNDYSLMKNKLSELVTNREIEAKMYKYVKEKMGVKICGAGQSGFLFIITSHKLHTIRDRNSIPIEFDYEGTKILLNNE